MYAMVFDSKAIYFFCIYSILDVKMSIGRGDLPHPLNIMYPNSKEMKFSPFFDLSSKIAYLLSYLNIILIVCLSCFTFVTNQRKNIPPE